MCKVCVCLFVCLFLFDFVCLTLSVCLSVCVVGLYSISMMSRKNITHQFVIIYSSVGIKEMFE